LSFKGTDAKKRELGKDDVQFESDNEESTGRWRRTDDVFWDDQRRPNSCQVGFQKLNTVIEKNNDSENWNSITGGLIRTSSVHKVVTKHQRGPCEKKAPNRQDSFLV
jgi:hypothetical protein